MKRSYLPRVIAAILTAALLVGALPVSALATEAEPSVPEDSGDKGTVLLSPASDMT